MPLSTFCGLFLLIYILLSYVLADTGELHASLTKLSERIRSLEDALSAAHSLNSEEPHELLSPSLLDIKHVNLRKGGDSSKENRNSDLSKDILDSFGDLTLSERQNDGAVSFILLEIFFLMLSLYMYSLYLL